ncbi:MAG TPA: CAP domain-containing protein [Acidimicrobiia bacterium]|nr:CAP domain-containing protein [Acidimicrobiia bacterium]
MGSNRVRRLLVGGALVVAIAGASGTAVLFSGGDSPRDEVSAGGASSSPHRSSTTTSTSSTTTSTTTTTTAPPVEPAAPAPEPAPAPAPAPAPEPAPAPAAAPVCSGGAGGTAGAVLAAMNGDRGASGLGSLCWNSQLGGIAQSWAQWMANNQSLSHQDLNSVLAGTSFSTMGENLLVGPAGMDAGQMEAAWMGSGAHRANILGPFSAAGVGIAQSADGQWWIAVEFGG